MNNFQLSNFNFSQQSSPHYGQTTYNLHPAGSFYYIEKASDLDKILPSIYPIIALNLQEKKLYTKTFYNGKVNLNTYTLLENSENDEKKEVTDENKEQKLTKELDKIYEKINFLTNEIEKIKVNKINGGKINEQLL